MKSVREVILDGVRNGMVLAVGIVEGNNIRYIFIDFDKGMVIGRDETIGFIKGVIDVIRNEYYGDWIEKGREAVGLYYRIGGLVDVCSIRRIEEIVRDNSMGERMCIFVGMRDVLLYRDFEWICKRVLMEWELL